MVSVESVQKGLSLRELHDAGIVPICCRRQPLGSNNKMMTALQLGLMSRNLRRGIVKVDNQIARHDTFAPSSFEERYFDGGSGS